MTTAEAQLLLAHCRAQANWWWYVITQTARGEKMPGYVVAPQHVIDTLALALSTNPNTGAVIAEQLLRTESGGDLVQKIIAGGKLSAQEKAQLPYLMPGHTWDTIADRLKEDHAERVDLPPTS